ncbi:MAG: bifunctional sugar-1-phosphate nucleotidylyltransferase/acetyltransferase [Caldisphaera sp.]|jgi:bifunctional UDP-N-acetylglucosamine pyrophosphorylase/glucosamine-1-phosphate N-acetyltransferase|uniref:bifunctional sugar-1-phosphate nucleotidylyltransferase/acetyltransferase n=1 Tax=Caldisphaera sp. TaxID=2060322 RepID=UPI003D0978D2
MKLVLLAGGKGERLKPLTETSQKTLMPILNKPLICRHLEKLTKNFNFEKIIIIISYKKEQVIDTINKCIENNKNIVYLDQIEEKGTGHAIKLAMDYGGEDDYLIVYSDLYLSNNVYNNLIKLKSPGIVVTDVNNPINYGVVKIENEIVKEIKEKPKSNEYNSNTIFAGIIRFPYEAKKYLDSLRLSPRNEYEVTDAIRDMIKEFDISVLKIHRNEWQDIGRPWELLLANRLALDEEIKNQVIMGEVHETVIIKGNVFIDKNAEIKPYTVIEGPAFISRNTSIGPSSHIRPYTILIDNSSVGYSVEVKGSIIMNHAKLPHFNYVGDSIVGEHVNLGAGTITANLRFDHKPIKMKVKEDIIDTGMEKLGSIIGEHAQTGINVSILPGKKIGPYALIYPGCVVDRDVNSHEIFKCK